MKKRILLKFGQRVREERLKRNLSQEELAEKAGVHRTYIGMIERAEKNITITNIEKMALALEIEISDLFENHIKSMNWIQEVSKFCQDYNISLEFLAETLRDPKVIPMIRGKAFEFFVTENLKQVLPSSDWEVNKSFLNPQLGYHDSDVRVTHIRTGKILSVECKMAGKGSYSEKGELNIFRVKCMRSRTLGEEKIKQLAPVYGVPESVLKTHNDQYLPTDFSIVVTSIGNAFYETDESGIFVWKPSERGEEFLKGLRALYKTPISLKDFGFSRMYVARAYDIAITNNTGVLCTRRKCTDKTNCGFIPNYPVIVIPDGSKYPVSRWTPIEESLQLFESFI